MKFGHYLQNCRNKLEWTQPEAALKIGVEQSHLSSLESGQSYPSEAVFEKLVEVYKIDINMLYDKISSTDLSKLKEFKQVSTIAAKKDQLKTTATRSWLLMGFIMLLIGGTLLVIAWPSRQWLLAPTFMLLFSSFACFYISRRWS